VIIVYTVLKVDILPTKKKKKKTFLLRAFINPLESYGWMDGPFGASKTRAIFNDIINL